MELRYKIKEIPDEGLVCDQALPADLIVDALTGLEPDLAQCSGSVHLTLSKAHSKASTDVVVAGRISAALTLACGSCLKPAALLTRVPVNAVYTIAPDADDEDEDDDVASEESLDAADILHYDGREVDLRPLIREQLILSLPMSPRCKEDCKGLCPVCGEDRNLTACGHTELRSVKFSPLKSLKLE